MKKNDTYKERRKYLRLDASARVNVKSKKKGTKKPSAEAQALAKNMSIEGICFISDKKLSPGKAAEVEIYLPGERKPLHIHGDIVWTRKVKKGGKAAFESGIKLATIQDSDEGKFIGYVSSKFAARLGKYLHL